MQQYDGFEAKRTVRREILPAGGYVVQIKRVEELEYTWGTVLLFSFDIAEGEHKGFFAADYRQNTWENKKWRGVYRLSCPKGDGSPQDDRTKRTFNNAVAVLQESNPGYTWDWGPIAKEDYSQLKGKLVGVLFRDREWEMDGRTGWNTEACYLVTAQDVRDGNFSTPAPRALGDSPAASQNAAASGGEVLPDLTDEDLPF